MSVSSTFGFRRTATGGPSVVARVPKSFWILSSLAVGAFLLLASPPASAQTSTLPNFALSINPTTMTEGSSDVEVAVTATLTEAAESAIRVGVTVGKGGDTAAAGIDYTTVNYFVITIASGQTSSAGTFELSSTDNNIAGEPSKTITITGTSIPHDSSNPSTGNSSSHTTLTITDNDLPSTSIDLSIDGNGVEGDTKKITATAAFPDGSATLTSSMTVALTVGSGTAISGTDFTAVSPFNIVIEKGKSSGKATFDLIGLEDSVVEGGENINVSAISSGFAIEDTQFILLDNDIIFSIDTDISTAGNQTTVREDINTKVIRVTASFPGSSTLTTDTVISITVGNENDSATKGVGNDYTVTAPTSPYTVIIPARSSQAFTDFTLSFTNDTKHENDETISFGLSSSFHVENAELIIKDNDIKLSVNPTQVYEHGLAKVRVVATLPEGSVAVGAIPVNISAGKEGDTATKGVDYTGLSNVVVTIPDGGTTGFVDFNFNVLNDGIYGTMESVTFHGSFGSTDVTNIGKYDIDEALLTIAERTQFWLDLFVYTFKGSGSGITNIRQATISEGSTGRLGGRIVTRGPRFSGTATITFGGSATLSTHLSEGDYSLPSLAPTSLPPSTPPRPPSMPPSLSLPISDIVPSSIDFPFSIVDDNIAEGPETILTFVTLNGSRIEGDSLTIIDNDVAPSIINLTVDTDTTVDDNANEVAESSSSHTISVTASFPAGSAVLPRPVSLTVSMEGYGGTGGAKSSDFRAANLTLTIPAGSTSATGTITLWGTDDNVAGEGKEKVSVTATNADTSDTSFTINESEFYIIDGDQKPDEIILTVDADDSMTGNQSSVTEGAVATTVSVTASFPDDSTVLADAATVSVSVVGKGRAGEAEPADFTAVGLNNAVGPFNVTILPEMRSGSATFTLTTVQDNFAEGNETITVSGTLAPFTITSRSITIEDDDPFPVISLSVDADNTATGTQTSVGEGSTAKTAQVMASMPSDSKVFESDTKVTVTVAGKGGTGGAETADFAMVTDFVITIPAGQRSGPVMTQPATFSLDPTEDNSVEGDEKITISGVADRTGVSVTSTSVTITDNDTAPTVALSVDLDSDTTGDQKSIAEGDAAATVKVTAKLPTGSNTFESATDITITVVGETGSGKAEPTDFTTSTISESDSTIAKISFPAGGNEASTTFTLTITDDNVADKVSETITVSGTADLDLTFNGVSSSITVTGDSIVINADNDIAPTKIDLTVDTDAGTEALETSFTEGPTKTAKVIATFSDSTATLEDDVTVSVIVGSVGDTAKEKKDYKEIGSINVIIKAGNSKGSTTFELEETADNLAGEGMETVSVSGTSRSDIYRFDVTGSSFTINDGDTPPTDIVLTVDTDSMTMEDQTTVTEDSGDTTVEVTASFPVGSAALTTDTTVDVTVAGGTATIGALNDFTTNKTDNKFTITITAESTSGSGSFVLTVVNDRIYDQPTTNMGETVTVSGELAGFTFTNATVTIVDNEVADLDPSNCSGTYVESSKILLVADCEALIEIRNAWSPNLESTHPLRTWGIGNSRDIDRWSGITISGQQVTKVLLPGNSTNGLIGGWLPTTIGDLSKLVELDLSGNNLSNNMSVNIPNQFGQLTVLEKLDLSDNNLSGSAPSRLWSSLTKLKTLDLSGNEFSGAIPSRLRNLSTLTDLDLSDNKFSGNVPGSLDRLTALKTLDISNNELTGTIPRRLGNLASSGSLTKFSFCNNNLRGSLPSAFRTGVSTPGIVPSDYNNIAICRRATP